MNFRNYFFSDLIKCVCISFKYWSILQCIFQNISIFSFSFFSVLPNFILFELLQQNRNQPVDLLYKTASTARMDVDFVEFYTRTLNKFIISITIAYFFFIFLYLVFRLVDNNKFGCKREGCRQRFETLIFFITKITLTFIWS